MRKSFMAMLSLFLFINISFCAEKKEENTTESQSGKGVVVYKVEGDPADIMIALKGNLEAEQIIVVTTTDPAAPLANNVKLFPDYKKLKVDYIQNFLVTSMSTLYKIYTADPNGMVISPLVITIYQYENDNKTYIVRTKPSLLLQSSKNPAVIEAVEELENRIDKAIKQLM